MINIFIPLMILNVLVTGFTKSISYKEVKIKTAEPKVSVHGEAKIKKPMAAMPKKTKKMAGKAREKTKNGKSETARKLLRKRKALLAIKRKRLMAKKLKARKHRGSVKTRHVRKPIIMLDTQHVGKHSNPGDRGASGFGLSEAGTTEKYMDIAAKMLKKDGYGVIRAGYQGKRGEYVSRAAYAKRYGASLYFAGHLNAGGKNYSLVETSYNAKSGSKRLMNTVARAFKKRLGTPLVKRKVLSSGERGNKCVRAATPKIPAVILEPYFIDNHKHAVMLKKNGPKRVAEAIVDTVEKMVPKRAQTKR